MIHQKISHLNVKRQQGLALLTPSLLWQFSSVTKCDAFFLSPTQYENQDSKLLASQYVALDLLPSWLV